MDNLRIVQLFTDTGNLYDTKVARFDKGVNAADITFRESNHDGLGSFVTHVAVLPDIPRQLCMPVGLHVIAGMPVIPRFQAGRLGENGVLVNTPTPTSVTVDCLRQDIKDAHHAINQLKMVLAENGFRYSFSDNKWIR